MTELIAGYAVTVAIAFPLLLAKFVHWFYQNIKSGSIDGVHPDALKDSHVRHVLYALSASFALLVASIWIHLLVAIALARGALFVLHLNHKCEDD